MKTLAAVQGNVAETVQEPPSSRQRKPLDAKLLLAAPVQLLMEQSTQSFQCREASCSLPSCQKMEGIILHSISCRRRKKGWCCPCKYLLINSCRFHSMKFTDNCQIPHGARSFRQRRKHNSQVLLEMVAQFSSFSETEPLLSALNAYKLSNEQFIKALLYACQYRGDSCSHPTLSRDEGGYIFHALLRISGGYPRCPIRTAICRVNVRQKLDLRQLLEGSQPGWFSTASSFNLFVCSAGRSAILITVVEAIERHIPFVLRARNCRDDSCRFPALCRDEGGCDSRATNRRRVESASPPRSASPSGEDRLCSALSGGPPPGRFPPISWKQLSHGWLPSALCDALLPISPDCQWI